MAVTQISQSTFKQGLEKYQSFIGGYSPMYGSFESISTVTVGSGTASQFEFTVIPSGYQHLQIRGIAQHLNASGTGLEFMSLTFNDATTGYINHQISGGFPGGPNAGSNTGLTNIRLVNVTPTSNSGTYAPIIIDILDYANTSKTKTVRMSFGNETISGVNQNCYVVIASGMWNSTNAINKVSLGSVGPNFTQYTSFALYGVR
jgi:hypothetical protein